MPLGSDKVISVTARIVVATNVDLEQKQKCGVFRKDLYFRLCTHRIEIPPLRERTEDIPALLDHLLDEAAQQMGKKKPTPPDELSLLLTNYPFPGNIRELRSMVFNAVSMHNSKKLSMESFIKAMGRSVKESVGGETDIDDNLLTFHERLPTLKKAASLLVLEAIKRTKGNQSMAARLLGITQPALSSRLKTIVKK
jgi:DNA-binding NtrC family response regulator